VCHVFGLANEGDALLVIRPDGYLGLRLLHPRAGRGSRPGGYTARVLGDV